MGAGAIGGTLAAYLSRAGRDVTVIDAWPAHIDKIKTNGLTVTTMEGTFTAKPEALHIGELSATTNRYDVVFVSVKSYDTAWVTTLVEPHLAPGGVIVSAQNGINEDIIARNRGVGSRHRVHSHNRCDNCRSGPRRAH